MRVFTESFSSPITITSADRVYSISVKANGGTVQILGDGEFQGMQSAAITLNASESWTGIAEISNPFEGITITPVAGIAEVEINLF